MTTLEERIAEVINDYHREGMALSRDAARAVVAVLPTADVSDDYIYEVLRNVPESVGSLYLDKYVIDGDIDVMYVGVRALLDQQAAAHAAEVEALRAEVDAAEDARHALAIEAYTAPDADWDTMLDSLRSRIRDALDETAEIKEQLSAAIDVHDELQTTAGGLHAEVEALRAENARLRVYVGICTFHWEEGPELVGPVFVVSCWCCQAMKAETKTGATA